VVVPQQPAKPFACDDGAVAPADLLAGCDDRVPEALVVALRMILDRHGAREHNDLDVDGYWAVVSECVAEANGLMRTLLRFAAPVLVILLGNGCWTSTLWARYRRDSGYPERITGASKRRRFSVGVRSEFCVNRPRSGWRRGANTMQAVSYASAEFLDRTGWLSDVDTPMRGMRKKDTKRRQKACWHDWLNPGTSW